MFGVQSAFRAAAASPESNVPMLLLATAGMSRRNEVLPLVVMDIFSKRRPDLALKFTAASARERTEDFPPTFSVAVAGLALLDDAVARNSERVLDELQQRLSRSAAMAVRSLALLLGFGGAAVAQWQLKVPPNAVFITVGLAGGVLAILLRDGQAALTSRSSR